MNPEILVGQKVSLQIRGQVILRDLHFVIRSGESVALVGHNGAGKTSLFHLILGLKLRTAGELKLGGKEVETPAARTRLGYVPERPYLALDSTLRRTLRFLGGMSGLSGRALEERIITLAREVELDSVLDRSLKTFSKGMLQKTLIAQADLHEPHFLILDEPMSGLDPEARQFFKSRIKKWRQMGRTLLFSSHSMEDAQELADRVWVMEAGRITFDGSVEEWGHRGIRGGNSTRSGESGPDREPKGGSEK